jgi:hypothetical protein
MNMSAVCRYWDIPNPIAKRDRKSGAKKRKQIEVERQSLIVENHV